ncbi:hypothetical protein [Caldifermentibacillus hisashii]|uniref:hypothetical protein n=1 Tax=Caldifermentibacillus hisashii TaxID=996558 RepID=UPI000BA47CD5|nr:hypothetical protein [Caldifermentibacillus hisashii]PAC30806.1 hypothetical protein CEJ87_18040 [Caldifermentibacillus hisashii]
MLFHFKNIISIQYYTYKYYVNMLLHFIKKDFSSFQWIKKLKNHLIFLSTFIYASYSILLIVFQVLFHLSDDETGIINVFIAALIILYSIALTSDIGKKTLDYFSLTVILIESTSIKF